MSKKIFTFIVLLLTFSFVGTAQVKKVAILPLRDINKEIQPGPKLFIRSSMSSAITETQGYEAYDRINLSAIMNEQDFQRNGLVRDSEIHKIGEMTGADYVLDAIVAPFDNNSVAVDAKITNVETARIENEAVEIIYIGDVDKIKAGCRDLTQKLLKGSGANAHPVSRPAVSSSQNQTREGFVDLGLSVKWAECNLGASSPEQYGDYYAWGETSTKSYYTDETYEYLGNPSVLPLARDVANIKIGDGCRMPTKEEWNELRTKCKWTWRTHKGVNGYMVEAKNGNCIFLPAAGHRIGDRLNFAGSDGYYWSSSLRTLDPSHAYYVYFTLFDISRDSIHYRSGGQSVRPVSE